MVVRTGDMQPFSLMPREVPKLQSCPLHLYHTSPLVKAAGTPRVKAQKGDPGFSLYESRIPFSTLESKRLFKMNMGLKAILYKIFFKSLFFLSHIEQKHRAMYAGRTSRSYLV